MKTKFLTLLLCLIYFFSFAQLKDDTECDVFIQEGTSYYKAKDYEKALKTSLNAFQCEANNKNQDLLYNISCFAALAKKKDLAFQYLFRSIRCGYLDTNNIKDDADLHEIRKDKR
jgi:hypothetical protein